MQAEPSIKSPEPIFRKNGELVEVLSVEERPSSRQNNSNRTRKGSQKSRVLSAIDSERRLSVPRRDTKLN